jgi:hypothetical protein
MNNLNHLLGKVINTLLRPLVRLLIEYGVTYPQMCLHLKSLFVEVVNQDIPLDGKPQTLSRISLLSGVHRKDVKRIMENEFNTSSVNSEASLSARVLGCWLGDPLYLDAHGKPAALQRLNDSSARPSFDNLVTSINKDIRPRVLLDEWLRTGMISLNEEGAVVLDAESFVTEKNFDQRAHFFARNMRDHMACGVHNLLPHSTDKLLERAVFYDGLSAQSVEKLRVLSNDLAMQQLQQINSEALRLATSDLNSCDANYRMTFGCYFYQTKQDGDPQEELSK